MRSLHTGISFFIPFTVLHNTNVFIAILACPKKARNLMSVSFWSLPRQRIPHLMYYCRSKEMWFQPLKNCKIEIAGNTKLWELRILSEFCGYLNAMTIKHTSEAFLLSFSHFISYTGQSSSLCRIVSRLPKTAIVNTLEKIINGCKLTLLQFGISMQWGTLVNETRRSQHENPPVMFLGCSRNIHTI